MSNENINERNFQDDLGAVLIMTYPGGKPNIRFPLGITEEFASHSIFEAKLPKRAENTLLRNNIATVGELVEKFDKVASFRGCGVSTAAIIKNNFLQYYYNSLSDKQVKEFWQEFIKINGFN